MNNEVFILGNNEMLMTGLRELISENFPGRKSVFTVKRVNLIELMNIDNAYRFNKKYSIALVPVHMYEALHIFAGTENIKLVAANISVPALSALLNQLLFSKLGMEIVGENDSLFLTAKERKYCYLVYSGISNKKIARYFQCTEKNVSYLKRKIMSKWQCKNSLDFYKIINFFYSGNDIDYGESKIA